MCKTVLRMLGSMRHACCNVVWRVRDSIRRGGWRCESTIYIPKSYLKRSCYAKRGARCALPIQKPTEKKRRKKLKNSTPTTQQFIASENWASPRSCLHVGAFPQHGPHRSLSGQKRPITETLEVSAMRFLRHPRGYPKGGGA